MTTTRDGGEEEEASSVLNQDLGTTVDITSHLLECRPRSDATTTKEA